MKTTQFTVKLQSIGGERGNYFNYGDFEKEIASGSRLVHTIELGSGGCILVFEKGNQDQDLAQAITNLGYALSGGALAGGRDNCEQALIEVVRRDLKNTREELEKFRLAAGVLCGAHIGVPLDECPVCRSNRLDEKLGHAIDERDKNLRWREEAIEQQNKIARERDVLHAKLSEAHAILDRHEFERDGSLGTRIIKAIGRLMGNQERIVKRLENALINYANLPYPYEPPTHGPVSVKLVNAVAGTLGDQLPHGWLSEHNRAYAEVQRILAETSKAFIDSLQEGQPPDSV